MSKRVVRRAGPAARTGTIATRTRRTAPPRTRRAAFDRRTTETQIRGRLTLDGQGRYDVSTGIRFLDHMLELFTRHGGFDLTLKTGFLLWVVRG